ncbi:unnamed protein product [Caenorhabditis brenneri]
MVSWSSLPGEIKGEVLKFSDFSSSQCLRICSKADLELVDSLKTKISFLKVTISDDSLTFIIVESPSDVLRIDLENDEDKEVFIYRSQTLEKSSSRKLLIDSTLENEISYFLNGVFQRKLEFDAVAIEINYIRSESPNLEILKEKLQKSPPKRLILSGRSFFKALDIISSQQKPELVIRNWTKDHSKNWNDFKENGLKVYEVSKWKTQLGVQEHVTASVAIGFYSYIAHIDSNPQKRIHWIPGFHVENPQKSLSSESRFSFDEFGRYSVYKLQLEERKTAFVKFTKCGVSIQVGDSKSLNLKDEDCGLDWMCPNCADKTMENWFFRQTIGNLHH